MPTVRGLVWVVAIVAVVVLPLAVAWPLGGLEAAQRPGPPKIGIGETVTGNRFALTPVGVSYAIKDPAPRFGDAEPGRFLVIDAKMTNVSDETFALDDIARDLDARVDGTPLDRVTDGHHEFVVRDDNGGELLHPGMPEKVRWTWKIPAKARAPRRLALSIRDEEYKPSFSLLGYRSGSSLWYRSGVMAILEAPIER